MKSSRVPILISLPMEMERVEILIAADIHTGSAEFDEKKWGQFEELLKRPDTFVIFAGDQCVPPAPPSLMSTRRRSLPHSRSGGGLSTSKPTKKKSSAS